MSFAILLIISYALGSIPFGLVIGFLVRDVDVRQYGSGNIGATNVDRVLGRRYAALALLLDAMKGFVPFKIAIMAGLPAGEVAVVGMAAVIGHCFPLILKFRGGKGVATVFGVVCALNLWLAALVLVVWGIGVFFSRISAVGGLLGACSLPLFAAFFYGWSAYFIMSVLMWGLIIFRHHKNIQQLWLQLKSRGAVTDIRSPKDETKADA